MILGDTTKMMNLNDIDPQFVKCVGYLHSSAMLTREDAVPLQLYLEDSIKNKTGIIKDFTNIVTGCLKPMDIEFKPIVYEESKTSNSDEDLELDLFNEDLNCIVCNGMDVGARNRLLECSDCQVLYHQECHIPVVTIEDAFNNWVCQTCLDKKLKQQQMHHALTAVNTMPIIPSSPVSSNNKPKSSSSSHRHTSSSSSSSSIYKASSSSKSSEKYKSSSSSKTSSVKGSGTTNVSGRGGLGAPNINIISADKRLQNMKKRAAKQQEKRKNLSR